MNKQTYNQLSGQILDASITVHKELGPGLLESVYELCLLKELQIRSIFVEHQVPVPLLKQGFRRFVNNFKKHNNRDVKEKLCAYASQRWIYNV